jgi:glucose/arabinose dehydrogenase
MNTPLSAQPLFERASISITSPPNDAVVSNNRTITADASDDVGVAVCSSMSMEHRRTGGHDGSYGANCTRLIPNGARTLTARARDTDNKTTLSALVNVTVANSDYFQNQVLATGFDLPTNIEFLPDGRMLVAELAGKIKVLPPPYTTPDPTPISLGRVSTACPVWLSTSTSQRRLRVAPPGSDSPVTASSRSARGLQVASRSRSPGSRGGRQPVMDTRWSPKTS